MAFPQAGGFGFHGTDWPATLVQHDWENRAAADARQANELAMQRSFEFNSAQAATQRDWAERMSNTSWQRGVSDMKAAGINPMAAYHSGGASSPTGASASGSPAHYEKANVTMANMGGTYQQQTAAQVELLGAQADRERAAAENLRGQTGMQPVQVEKLRKDMEQADEHIRLMIVQGAREGASAQHLQQQAQNLRASLPAIEASIKQMQSMVRLNDAQITQLAAQTRLTKEQMQEVIQRVQANLPAAEAALIKLKSQHAESALNQAQARGTVYQGYRGEFIELLRAIKDAINPLNGLFGGGSTTTYGN